MSRVHIFNCPFVYQDLSRLDIGQSTYCSEKDSLARPIGTQNERLAIEATIDAFQNRFLPPLVSYVEILAQNHLRSLSFVTLQYRYNSCQQINSCFRNCKKRGFAGEISTKRGFKSIHPLVNNAVEVLPSQMSKSGSCGKRCPPTAENKSPEHARLPTSEVWCSNSRKTERKRVCITRLFQRASGDERRDRSHIECWCKCVDAIHSFAIAQLLCLSRRDICGKISKRTLFPSVRSIPSLAIR